jgi:hypothetical protein
VKIQSQKLISCGSFTGETLTNKILYIKKKREIERKQERIRTNRNHRTI